MLYVISVQVQEEPNTIHIMFLSDDTEPGTWFPTENWSPVTILKIQEKQLHLNLSIIKTLVTSL